jgi:hypothetical protein
MAIVPGEQQQTQQAIDTQVLQLHAQQRRYLVKTPSRRGLNTTSAMLLHHMKCLLKTSSLAQLQLKQYILRHGVAHSCEVLLTGVAQAACFGCMSLVERATLAFCSAAALLWPPPVLRKHQQGAKVFRILPHQASVVKVPAQSGPISNTQDLLSHITCCKKVFHILPHQPSVVQVPA